MKKILLTLLTIFMLVPLVGTLDSVSVKALGQNEMACGAFEVDYINDDGSFSLVDCYDDLSSAKSRMRENNDYVVRHANSLSYSKIVAMNSGIAYSYPRWGATLSIYQDLYNTSIYYKSTYVSRHYELDYINTPLAAVGKSGYTYGMIEVNINGFHGYCDLENVDLVPSKFINNGITIKLGGNNTYTGEDFFSIICKQNYYYKNDNGDLVFQMYYGYSDNGSDPESHSYVIGKASEQMTANTPYYSYNGYEFYTNRLFTDNKITYYNYYQFLPLRSKSTISADKLNSYIAGYSGSVMIGQGQAFIDAQEKYGVNALILFSMAIHESGYGRSGYATKRNNLFGWNAYDASPNSASYFDSVYQCVNEQAGINLRGYLDIYDGRFFSSSLGNKGSGLNVKYASDPYWGMKIASYCYSIDKNYNNSNDLNKYSLSLVNTFDIPLKSSPNDSASTLYTTQYGPYYQENYIVVNLGDAGNGYTKVQSTNPIDSNGNVKTHRSNPVGTGTLNDISSGEYNFETSVAYIKSSYLTSLNSSNGGTSDVPVSPETPTTKDKKAYSGIDSLTLADGYLNISGYAVIEGADFGNKDNVTFVLNLRNVNDDEVYKYYVAEVSKYDGIMFDDNLDYTYTGYSVSIPTSDIMDNQDFTGGVYYLSIDIISGETEMSSTLSSTNRYYYNMNYVDEDYTFHISSNSRYTHRIELTIESVPEEINYNTINKPYINISSFFAYDTLSIDEDGNFYIYGQGMIYYLDYDNKDAITYTLYIVDDKNNYVAIPCTTMATDDVDAYKKALKTSYNIDNICFEGKANLKELINEHFTLEEGYYEMILKIENGNNVDYVELNTLSSINKTSGNFRIFRSNVRNRIMLEVIGNN